jgi:hemoglobin
MTANALPLLPSRSPHFEMLGGEPVVVRLVEAFYGHMDRQEGATGIRAMHGRDLTSVKATLVLFLCEWLGGPQGYSARQGHPRLRLRHAGFAIGAPERDAWLACMQAALIDVGVAPALQQTLMASFFKTADWMRNTGPHPATPASSAHPATNLKETP